jgi:hypothetical protein
MLDIVMLSLIILSGIMLSAFMLSVFMLSAFMLSVIMLSVIMLSVVMLSVIMLSVIILSVILLSVILLSGVFLSVEAHKKCSFHSKGWFIMRPNFPSFKVITLKLYFLFPFQVSSIFINYKKERKLMRFLDWLSKNFLQPSDDHYVGWGALAGK